MTAFLETSVVVRYLIGQPAAAADEASRIVNESDDLQIMDVVVAEVAWVLESYYHVTRKEIVDLLVDLIQRQNISVFRMDRGMVVRALLLCEPSRRVSIADALIWATARQSGILKIYSFDRRFPSEGVELHAKLYPS